MLVKHRLPVPRFGRREVSPPRNPTKASGLSMAAAWQVRDLAGFGEPCLRFGDAPLGRLKALPQRPDRGVPPGVAQVAEVGELGHTAMKIDPAVTASSAFLQASRCAGRSSPAAPPGRGDEQSPKLQGLQANLAHCCGSWARFSLFLKSSRNPGWQYHQVGDRHSHCRCCSYLSASLFLLCYMTVLLQSHMWQPIARLRL
jgi:hypothetical protein